MLPKLYCPWTGARRDPRDVQSDPEGLLMWDGITPLKAAKKPVAEVVLKLDYKGYQSHKTDELTIMPYESINKLPLGAKLYLGDNDA